MPTPTLQNCSFLINSLEPNRKGAITFKKKNDTPGESGHLPPTSGCGAVRAQCVLPLTRWRDYFAWGPQIYCWRGHLRTRVGLSPGTSSRIWFLVLLLDWLKLREYIIIDLLMLIYNLLSIWRTGHRSIWVFGDLVAKSVVYLYRMIY